MLLLGAASRALRLGSIVGALGETDALIGKEEAVGVAVGLVVGAMGLGESEDWIDVDAGGDGSLREVSFVVAGVRREVFC